MEFIKHMKEREDSKRERELLLNDPKFNIVSKKSYQFRRFEPFYIHEGLALSIQAGYGTYCTPSYTFDDLAIYQTMELAIVTDRDLVRVSDVLPEFKKLEEIEFFYNDAVYAEVPVELIEELYQEAMKLKRKIENKQ